MKPQRMEAEIKKRIEKTGTKSAYDFHTSRRRGERRVFVEGRPMDVVLSEMNTIKRVAERNAAKAGLKSSVKFFKIFGGELFPPPSVRFESPNATFAINFRPDLGIAKDGISLAIHNWNTKSPDLTERVAKATLSLIAPLYGTEILPAILCLRTMNIYVCSPDIGAQKAGAAFCAKIEALIDRHQSDEMIESAQIAKRTG